MKSIPPMAARTFENPPQIGSAAPEDASPEAESSERQPAEPTANRAIDPRASAASGLGARLPGRLQNLAETARDYAKASSSENTRKAYGSDWRHFSGWARRHGLPALPPDPQILGLYVAACASGAITGKPDSVATLERRISALRWNFAQRGETFDRADRHVATVLAGVRRTQGRPPEQKEAILPEDLLAMIATLDLADLRSLRDRAILLLGFAGGLRRSEIVGLDRGARQTQDGSGWTEILDDGVLVTLRGKTGWREVEIGRGSSDLSCPVVALEAWLKFARIANGPLFRRVFADGNTVDSERLADKHVARQTRDGTGWTEILDDGILVTLRGKTGWREVEIGRGSSDLSCPVVALEAWLKFARIAHGPLFRRVFADGNTVDSERLADKHVARLVKRTAMAAGVRGDLAEGERAQKFSGHSLRAGLASAAEVDERFMQKQLGHASAEMTRRYQRRRDRFRVNLTKAAGL